MDQSLPAARDGQQSYLEAPIEQRELRNGAKGANISVKELDRSESGAASQRPTSNISKQSKQSEKGDD